MDRDLAAFRVQSIPGHLAKGTRDSYGTGTRGFDEFSRTYALLDDTLWDQPQEIILRTMENFACYLRISTGITAHTINKYVTHVATCMRERGLPKEIHLRSPIFNMLIQSWERIDASLPRAERETIPCPASVFLLLADFVKESFKRNPTMASLYVATIAFAYALGVRPGHYTSDGSHVILGDSVHALFNVDDNAFYPVTIANTFPSSIDPIALLVFLKHSKNAPHGYGAPFVIHRAPPDSPFCLVSMICSHLRRFPPGPKDPFLSGCGMALSQSKLNIFLKEFAVNVGLDPSRFSASSFRVGHTIQLDTLSDFEQMRDTGHFSKTGKIPYLRASIKQAEKTAALLCDTSYHTLHMVQLQSGCHPRTSPFLPTSPQPDV